MSASSAGAIKALIEAAGLGVSVYRDRQPENTPVPYIVVHEAIATTPEAAFNQFDDPEAHVTELVQVDLWEHWRNPDGTLAESYTLGDAIAKTLYGGQLAAAPTHTQRLRLFSGPHRLLDVEANLIHKTYTVELHRVLERS